MRFAYHDDHVNELPRVGSRAAEATHPRPADRCGARADHRGRHAPCRGGRRGCRDLYAPPPTATSRHRPNFSPRHTRRQEPRRSFPTRPRKRWTNAWPPLPGSSSAACRRMSRSSARCCASRWVRCRTSCRYARAAPLAGSSRHSRPSPSRSANESVHRLALALRAACGIETRVWLSDVAGLAPGRSQRPPAMDGRRPRQAGPRITADVTVSSTHLGMSRRFSAALGNAAISPVALAAEPSCHTAEEAVGAGGRSEQLGDPLGGPARAVGLDRPVVDTSGRAPRPWPAASSSGSVSAKSIRRPAP